MQRSLPSPWKQADNNKSNASSSFILAEVGIYWDTWDIFWLLCLCCAPPPPCPPPPPSPALQVAEVQQIKLTVVLGVIDSVHILGARLPVSLSTTVLDPQFSSQGCTVYNTQKHSHINKGPVPWLLPTALPPCSWYHYSHTGQRRSLRSLLRQRRKRKNSIEEKNVFQWCEQLLLSVTERDGGRK